MRNPVILGVGLLLLASGPFQVWADETTCIVHLEESDPTNGVLAFINTPGGLMLSAQNGLFRYDGKRLVHLTDDPTGGVTDLLDTPRGLLLNAQNGLFRYDGKRVIRVEGDPISGRARFHDTPGGLLLRAQNGLFRYDGKRVIRVEGDPIGGVTEFHDTPRGLLLNTQNGLFRYDGTRTVHIGGEGDPDGVTEFHDTPGGLLLSAQNGLFRYDGKRVIRVEGDPIDGRAEFHDTPGGLLVRAENGLFRYDGKRVIRVEGDPIGGVTEYHDIPGGLFRYGVIRVEGPIGGVTEFHDTPGGLLVRAENGLFRYDGKRVIRVEGDSLGGPPQDADDFNDTPAGLLLSTQNGLFRYDGKRVIRVSDRVGELREFLGTPGGLLLNTENGLFNYDGKRVVRMEGDPGGDNQFHFYDNDFFFDAPSRLLLLRGQTGVFRVVFEPLSNSKIVLENLSELKGAVTSQLGIRTRWTMAHPCSVFADRFGLYVVATNAKGEDVAMMPAIGMRPHGDATSFEAAVPVSDAGEWTFRVVSMVTGTKTSIGDLPKRLRSPRPGLLGGSLHGGGSSPRVPLLCWQYSISQYLPPPGTRPPLGAWRRMSFGERRH
jgi:hypothetical protein